MRDRHARPLESLTLLVALLFAGAALAAEVEKSPNDEREYRYFELANGLRALVISDPDTDKAAASLDVNVGSGDDPDDRPGLVHFLEHMLFLGTEKYPEPGEYKAFIDEHGGRDNAYTAFDHTNYFFDVDKDHLEPALDRFAQFFVAPLFNPPYVDREREVVHSEFTARREDDGRRSYSAFEAIVNPLHPLSRFSIGSRETLADREGRSVRDDLVEFHRSRYSAGLMTLVVLGREPLDVLREWVTGKFAGVANTGARPLEIEAPLFPPGRLPARLDVVPVKEQRTLSLSFPVPPVRAHWREKPVEHISHLLGHEGPGSVLSELKSRGYADGLSAGLGFAHASGATVSIGISLTERGLGRVNEVVGLVFQALRLIEREGVEARYFDENRRLAEIGFRFQEKPRPLSTVRGLAAALHEVPPEYVLRAPYLYGSFDAALVREYLAHLVPENLLVNVVAPGLETDRETPYYDAPYRLRPLDPDLVAGWGAEPVDAALALPPPNPFIAENLALLEPRAATPVPVRLDAPDGIELWHQQDTTYRVPRVDFYLNLRSPVASDTPRHSVLTRLYVEMVNDQLNEFAYAAGLAGLDYRLYPHVRGITVRLSGYSDKEDQLLERIVSALAQPALRPARFEVVKAALLRRLRNQRDDSPYQRAMETLNDLLMDVAWTPAQRIPELEAVGVGDLIGFVPLLFREVEPVALAHGNLGPDAASALARIVDEGLLGTSARVAVASTRVVALEPGVRFVHRVENQQPDAAAVLHLQGSGTSVAERARVALLGQLVQSSFFDELRTERRLGYIVYAAYMSLMEVPGLVFVVQSPNTPAAVLEREMEAFLARFTERLAALDDVELERNRRAFLTDLLEVETRLSERTSRYWNELDRGHTGFDLRKRVAAEVRAVDANALRAAWATFAGPARRSLAVLAEGRGPAAGDGRADPAVTIVDDVVAFKASRPRVPK